MTRRLVEDIPAVVTGVSSAALALSAIHEYGYFTVIGLKFQSAMSASDYFNSALTWLPVLVVALTAGALIYISSGGRAAEDKFIASSRYPRLAALLTRGHWRLLYGTAILAPFVAFFFSPRSEVMGYLLGFAVLWPLVIANLVSKPSIAQRFTLSSLLLAIFGPLFLAMAYFNGLESGYVDLRSSENAFLLRTSDQTAKPVVVLRNFQKGVLVRWPATNKNEFIAWENIKSVANFAYPPGLNSRACAFLSFLCVEKPPPEP